MDLKALAMQVLDCKPPVKLEVKNVENRGKLLPLKNTQKFTPNFNEWLDKNRDNLDAAGFTERDLYSTRLPIGIAQLKLWNKHNLSVDLQGNIISFTWTTRTGQRVIQTCRPENELHKIKSLA